MILILTFLLGVAVAFMLPYVQAFLNYKLDELRADFAEAKSLREDSSK